MSSNGLINRIRRAGGIIVEGRGQGSDISDLARPGVEEGAALREGS